MIANLFLYVARVEGRAGCVCVCVCVHSLNKDVSQAIIGTFFFQCLFQKMVGWVTFEVSFRFFLKF